MIIKRIWQYSNRKWTTVNKTSIIKKTKQPLQYTHEVVFDIILLPKIFLWVSSLVKCPTRKHNFGSSSYSWHTVFQVHLTKYAFHPWRRYSWAASAGFAALMMPRPTMIMSLPLSWTTWKPHWPVVNISKLKQSS